MEDSYRQDLAYIHDAGFGSVAEHAAGVLRDALVQRGIRAGLVVDLGCGSGILSEGLAAGGYAVLGLDVSPAMLELARRRVPAGRFLQASWRTAEVPACVAVAAAGEVVSYVAGPAALETTAEEDLAPLFQRVHDALVPGGLFLFDVVEPGRVPGPGPQQRYVSRDDWTVLVTVEEDPARCLLTRQITSFRRTGELFRRDGETHYQRLLARREVAALLRGMGFRVRVLRGYGELPFRRGQVGFLARKAP